MINNKFLQSIAGNTVSKNSSILSISQLFFLNYIKLYFILPEKQRENTESN